MSQQFLIAADGGGTKTEFVLFSTDGRIIRRLVADGSNPHARGLETACSILSSGFRTLSAASGGIPVRFFYAGVAGALSSNAAAKMTAALAPRHAGVAVESDIVNVIFSARRPGKCVAAIAGTGSAVFGYDGNALVRAGGWGYLLDTAGGGFDIGRDVLRLCLEADERPEGTPLPLVIAAEERLGGRAIDHLDDIYSGGPSFVASFARDAFERARRGDDLARRIVRKAAARLAELALAVRGRCDCGDVLIASGGLLKSRDVLLPMLDEALGGRLRVEAPDLPPIFGACRRALVLAGLAAGEEFEARFRATYATDGTPGGAAISAAADKPNPQPAAANTAATEGRNLRASRLDEMDVVSMLRLLNDENARSVEAVAGALGGVARAVETVVAAFSAGGHLLYVGAGTSGRLAVLDASECPPTFGVSPEVVVANIAGGEGAFFRAVEGAEDDAAAGRTALLARRPEPRDVVMGVSASGNAAYVAGALEAAREAGCRTISLSSNRDCRIARIADIAVFTDTGPEVVAGSTRLKAGNAQKMVLNAITTCAMVLTGKVKGNLMVNLRPSNEKLKRRMVGIVAQLACVGPERAGALLEAAGFDIRRAVQMARGT